MTPYTEMGPGRLVITQTLIFTQYVGTEIHGLCVRLVAATETFAEITIAIQPPARNFRLYTGLGPVIVVIAAKLVVAQITDLGVLHIQGRRRASGQADNRENGQYFAHGLQYSPLENISNRPGHQDMPVRFAPVDIQGTAIQ